MIGNMGWALYGLDTGPGGRGSQGGYINLDTNSYICSNVAVLMRELGKAPDTGGTYTMRNRLIGQVAGDASLPSTYTRPASTTTRGHLRGGRSGSQRPELVIQYLNQSDSVHTISATRGYSLGGVEFSPNDAFSPNTMDRWTGLIFNNPSKTVLGLPHTHGDKWAVIDKDVRGASSRTKETPGWGL